LGLVFGLLLSLTASLRAQTLQGEVVDDRGRPVAYATIYVRETATGIVADEAGRFISHLERGDYTGEFSALGYEKVVVPFTVTGDAAKDRLRVELREMAYALREVAEDPAVAAGAGLVVLQCPDGLIHEQVDRALFVALAKAGGAEPLARHVVGRQDPVGRAGDGAGLPRAQGRGDALDEDVDLLQVVARLESGRHEGGVRGLVGCQRHNGLLDPCRGGGRRVRRGE